MFCPKCGTQIPDGSKFCPGCGSPVAGQAALAASPQPTAAPQQAPAYPQPASAAAPQQAPDASQQSASAYQRVPAAVPQQAPAYQQVPAYQPSPAAPQPPKKNVKPIIICAVVAAVAVIAVAVCMFMSKGGIFSDADANDGDSADAATPAAETEQETPWTSMDLSGNGYTHEFSIALDEPGGTLGPVTIYDQDEMVTAEISGNSGGDENIMMCQDDTVDWGDWGPDDFRYTDSSSTKECTLVAPGNATVENPWGRWSFLATCDDYSTGDQYLFTRSTTFVLNEDGTGSYEFAAMWGDYVSCEVADSTDPSYDPSAADANFTHSFTWERDGNVFDVTFDNGNTYTLTFE